MVLKDLPIGKVVKKKCYRDFPLSTVLIFTVPCLIPFKEISLELVKTTKNLFKSPLNLHLIRLGCFMVNAIWTERQMSNLVLNVKYLLLLSVLNATEFYNLGHIQCIIRVH